MSDKDRNTYSSCSELDLRIKHLLGFGHHLPFFFGVAVFHEDIDMRNHVKRDALGELLCRHRISNKHSARLLEQLIHAFLASARDGLVSRNDNALDRGCIVKRLQCHHKLRRRAIRVCYDVALAESLNRVRVHLRNNQWHIGIIAPCRRIIDNDTTLRRDLWRPFLGNIATSGHEADVGIGEVILVERLGLERLIAIRYF